MDVQSISGSGSDVVVREFSPENIPKREQAPEQNHETYTSRERPVEEGKGGSFDRLA